MTFNAQKYYRGIVPMPKDARPVEQERTHLQYTDGLYTGHLKGELVALQPLHVGSGVLVPPEKLSLNASEVPLVKAWMRREGEILIPGSSLKGVVRSLVELFTLACVCKTREWSIKRNRRYRECRYKSKQHRGDLCPACKLFGAMGYQGQVRFLDTKLVEGETALHYLPPQYLPRVDRDNPRRRYYPHALVDPREDRNWPLEVVQPGARFTFEAQFTNLSQGELGLLLIALGQGDWALCPKVGAGKSCGLGAVRIEKLEAATLDLRAAYTRWDTEPTWIAVDQEACLQAAEPLYQARDLETLARDLAQEEVPNG